jgi:hypothetical protein
MYKIEFDVETLYNTGSATITVKGGSCIEVRLSGKDFCHVIDGRAFVDKLLFAINCTGDSPASEEFRKRALLPPTAALRSPETGT